MSKEETIKFLWNEIRKNYRQYIRCDVKSYWYSFFKDNYKNNVYALKIVRGIK